MMERLKIAYPVITEGKYDKIKLESLIEAHILCTDGSAFSKTQKNRPFCAGCAIKRKSLC